MGGRTGEIILILIAFVLLFGAQKLPELGASIGKAIREFKKNLKDVNDESNKDQGATKSVEQNHK